MSLNKITTIDKIEIVENGILQIREKVDIVEDDTNQIVASNYHRFCLSPGDNLDNQNSKVVAIANAVWTPEVIAAYQEQLNNSLQNLQG